MKIVVSTVIKGKEYSDAMYVMIIKNAEIIDSRVDLNNLKTYFDYYDDNSYYFIKFSPDEDGYYQFEIPAGGYLRISIVNKKDENYHDYENGSNWFAKYLNEGGEYYVKIRKYDYYDDDEYGENNNFMIIEKIDYTEVEFEEKEIKMSVGETKKLSVKLDPLNSKAKCDYFVMSDSESDSDAMEIDNSGNVTAKKEGIATVNVRTATGDSDECRIIVTDSYNAPGEVINNTPSQSTFNNGTITPSQQSPKNVSSNLPSQATKNTNQSKVSGVTSTNKTNASKIKIKSLVCKKNTKKITGKLSVKGAKVKIKVGKNKYRKAKVKGKTFTLKLNYRLKKKTRISISVTRKNYKTLKKTYTVK